MSLSDSNGITKNREKRFMYNIYSSLLLQAINLVCGFILPRFVLKNYGSETNGIVTSITQYLAFINFLDLGVGAVTQSAYYLPLYNNDAREINYIYNESSIFFKKVAIALIGYMVFLCFLLPRVIQSSYGTRYIVTLILILSFNQFAQFFFAIKDQLLLSASQQGYILNITQVVLVILNTMISVVLISIGKTIHVVKLASALVFIINPIVLHDKVNKTFSIDRKLSDESTHIPQKKNGFAQHCATVIMNNTDVVILTFLSSLANVSVYAVYNLVFSGIKQLISIAGTSFTPLIGSIYAENNEKRLKQYFNYFEWAIHILIVFIYTLTSLLVVPFVINYTRGVYDAQYSQPVFSIIMTIAFYAYGIRIPYISIINAAGHYRQTQKSAVVEAVINIALSIILVYRIGLVGVAIGTLFAIIYRTLYLCFYLKYNILKRDIKLFINYILLDCTEVVLSLFVIRCLTCVIKMKPAENYFVWSCYAIIYGLIVICVVLTLNMIFYRKNLGLLITRIITKLKKKGKSSVL